MVLQHLCVDWGLVVSCLEAILCAGNYLIQYLPFEGNPNLAQHDAILIKCSNSTIACRHKCTSLQLTAGMQFSSELCTQF